MDKFTQTYSSIVRSICSSAKKLVSEQVDKGHFVVRVARFEDTYRALETIKESGLINQFQDFYVTTEPYLGNRTAIVFHAPDNAVGNLRTKKLLIKICNQQGIPEDPYDALANVRDHWVSAETADGPLSFEEFFKGQIETGALKFLV